MGTCMSCGMPCMSWRMIKLTGRGTLFTATVILAFFALVKPDHGGEALNTVLLRQSALLSRIDLRKHHLWCLLCKGQGRLGVLRS